MSLNLDSFKAYDLRGRVPDELNEEIVYAVGRAFADFLEPKHVVVGHDIRLSSPALCSALTGGLTDSGVDVAAIGVCGTEEIYFATDHFKFDGGIMVTASHNPKDYNGLKLVRSESRPISADTGLDDIKRLVAENRFAPSAAKGKVERLTHRSAYIERLLARMDTEDLKPFKIVANPGNGGAGIVVEQLKSRLPVEFIEVQFAPDGNFPNGVPNPLLPENRVPTLDAIKQHGADLGLAWDGDFDRCFLFDEQGRYIEGYYIVGLLAQAFLVREPGSAIVHDPRLTWNTQDLVQRGGGRAVESKAGHAFMKERMRLEDAVYGGEMSAHHYFRDFAFCDSGMLPWLLVIDLMSKQNCRLSELVDERIRLYPVSGEINRRIADPAALLEEVQRKYAKEATDIQHLDGLSMTFANWRFNLRPSNTEPVVRLNVESRGDVALM
ncbi:MAG: phosphomannomutase, partial [Pseudomonadales bacterium]